MNLRFTYTFFFAMLLLVVSLGNKNGRASTPPGAGNTGAPGDEALPNGTPIVCNSCHTPSQPNPISSSVTITILDSVGNEVTEYLPGRLYTARVKVNTLTGNPQRWGFQMIALEDEGNTDIDGFSDINPNNYKIATVNSTGRTYAEHDNSSTSNIFNVRWTAPIAGTGSVTFYAAGNAVNNNGQNTGDGASYSNLKLEEGSASSTHNPDAESLGMRIWPNPVAAKANISVMLPRAGDYQVAVYDLSGRLVSEKAYTLPAGENRLEMSAAKWDAGIYFVNFSGNGISANIKVAKF